MSERREYEQAATNGKPATRRVKLPGDAGFVERSESPRVIAKRLMLEKRQRELEAKIGRR
ncbi:hypothetical protein [Agrobacterium tumefaciens]|uniref:Uncharacterized protein n=1 Tax=Agrobacterium tumefaciens TaxID=358 RepID=A0A4D7YED1_AGRTU|nr:hypothetical protein [Agrobacterium tumefaciens]QCL92897.1 hypothetical protein CFBP7129_00825 [Agrobacterium tumefaciens]